MIPHRTLVGQARAPVLTVDGIGPDPAQVVALASELAPFPAAGNLYPGVRLVLSEQDERAWDYVVSLLEAASPYLCGAFDLDGFTLVEASFSMVTTVPAMLAPLQRVPHFDSLDANYYAILHYLSDCAGTAFFRHVPSGSEVASGANAAALVAALKHEGNRAQRGYCGAGSAGFERIGSIAGKPGRLAAYPGNLLHSGIIPADIAFSDDPARGRLTTNIFIQGTPSLA